MFLGGLFPENNTSKIFFNEHKRLKGKDLLMVSTFIYLTPLKACLLGGGVEPNCNFASRWTQVLADQLQIILKGILEEDRNAQDNEATVKAKYFYQSCMDMGKQHPFTPPPSPPHVHMDDFFSQNCGSVWPAAPPCDKEIGRLAGDGSWLVGGRNAPIGQGAGPPQEKLYPRRTHRGMGRSRRQGLQKAHHSSTEKKSPLNMLLSKSN